MRIRDVLDAKGSRVVSIRPSKTLDKIPPLFEDRGVASAVVVDLAGQPIGLMTDRLFIRAIARHGIAALQMTVGQVMLAPAPTCEVDQDVPLALRRMTDDRVRHLVVLKDHQMIGLVSIGDLVKHRLLDAEMESRVLRDLALGHLSTTT
jgi:CBS domain-containing protein